MSDQELILEQLRNVNYDKLSKQDIVTMLDAGEQTLENMAIKKTAIDIIAEAMNQTKNTLEALDYSGKVEAEIRKNLSILRATDDWRSIAPRLGELDYGLCCMRGLQLTAHLLLDQKCRLCGIPGSKQFPESNSEPGRASYYASSDRC